MSDSGGLYEKVLAAAGGELGAAKPPRPSAAVVLFRRLPDGQIELFWLQRGAILPFMGGWHAFPGGGLERGDVTLPVAGTPTELAAEGWTPASPEREASPKEQDLVPGLVACALRELFEETGVLIAGPPVMEVRGGWTEGSHGARSALPQREDPMGYGPDRTPSGDSPDVVSVAELRRSQLAGEKHRKPLLNGAKSYGIGSL